MRNMFGLTAMVLCVAMMPVEQVSAQGTTLHSGSWIWVKRPGGHPMQRDTSTLTANADYSGGRYCYNADCWNVKFTVQGNAYRFSTNGINLIEFESPEPQVFIGRYWGNKANVAQGPDAVVRMDEQ